MFSRTHAHVARWPAVLVSLASLLASGRVEAQGNPACNTLPNPIYGIGGSAQRPLMRWIGAQLAGAPQPATLIYAAPGACFGVNAILEGTTATGNANYWEADGTQRTCTLPAVTGQAVDFGLMGNSAALCAGVTLPLPATVGDFLGPISSVSVIVNELSTETSISSGAIKYVYGQGAAANVAPWNNDTYLFHRNDTSYVQLYLALAAGISSSGWYGTAPANDVGTNENMVLQVAASGNEQQRLGFVSSEVADANRATVNTLAYQHYGQSCGYLPDSTPTALDKANVRNGQYWLWGPTHFFATVDGNGDIVSPGAAQLIGLIQGTTPAPSGVNILDAVIRAGNIPECAMRVSRSGDLGALASFAPADPCGCYYEAEAGGSTSCAPCDVSTPCTGVGQVCRYGFCEAY